jgi:predicted nucleic acid-binding protein
MATPVFVDTGAHYALTDASDPDHEEVVRLFLPSMHISAPSVRSVDGHSRM